MSQFPTYVAYLLRCWSEGTTWRYSLEEIGNGKRHGFASLDEFVSFLLALQARAAGQEPSQDEVKLPEQQSK
jgi:hypothetical protein